MKSVKIYTTPTCPYCHMAKEFFKANNVEFQEFDVAADEKARNEMMEKSGQLGVPVIDVDGQIVVGFDEPKLKELLKIA
ncbi:thioredoxin family protein [Candidatus Azambacteria bacterium]|nr:thioredoxin family protein [Candidatus Azambacteria bacterium]